MSSGRSYVSRRVMQHSTAAEAILLRLAQGGDSAAFDELVLRRQGSIRSLLRRLCGDSARADDFAQHAFLQAWISLSSLKSHAAFSGWLRSIAVRTWLDSMRRKEPLASDSVELDENHRSLRYTESPDIAADIDRGLARLSPPERLCVVLFYQDRLTHIEISEAIPMPLGTVKSHIGRGTAKLREALSDYAQGEIR